jgi:glycosyltransferase involved in cell wall biosynthesis
VDWVELSVVIPCYNAEAVIGEQLEALSRQVWDGRWEVVVSENGSTDRSADVVERFRGQLPALRIVDSSSSRGRAGARNVGIAHARGDRILTCDADDVVCDGYVATMAAALEQHDFVAARLEEYRLNAPWQVESWGNGQATGLLRSRPPFLPYAGGGTLGFRKNVFERVNGFDPRFRTREDQDFCWRVQISGIPLHFIPDAVLHYRYPTELHDMYRQSRSLAETNVQIYRLYRARGMPRMTRDQALRGNTRWSRLLRRLPKVPSYDRVDRARFIRDLGDKVGRLRGSVRYRTLAL